MARWTFLALLGGAVACAPAAVTQAQPEGFKLSFPVACDVGRTCEVQNYMDRDPGPAAKDYRCGGQTYEGHSGVDIRVLDMAAQRTGVDVLAAADGRVKSLRDGMPDSFWRKETGSAVEGRECGNGVLIDHGDGWETQYCHLARGSVRVKVGDQVAAGAPIGRIGLSGQTEFPHLHITVRRAGQTVDPFAPEAADAGACAARSPLWTAEALAEMPYKIGAVLNTGFAPGPVKMADIEDGRIPPPGPDAPYLVAYARGIGLLGGDEVELELKAPNGTSLARSRPAPMDRDKAQHFIFVGKKRPATGWPSGAYTAEYRIWRGGKVVASRRFQATL